MEAQRFHKLHKGSSSSYRLGLLTCVGKPVPQVADIRRNLFPHLYQLFFTRLILRRHSARNISTPTKIKACFRCSVQGDSKNGKEFVCLLFSSDPIARETTQLNLLFSYLHVTRDRALVKNRRKRNGKCIEQHYHSHEPGGTTHHGRQLEKPLGETYIVWLCFFLFDEFLAGLLSLLSRVTTSEVSISIL